MRELLVVPDPRLRQKSQPVAEINGYVAELVSEMLGNLDSFKAIGFSAPQFGELLRVFVVRYQGIEIVMVNPEIVKEVGGHSLIEGCKSIPGKWYYVRRPKIVKVRGLGLDGKIKTVKAHDVLAACLRHEYDHLEGTLIDRIGVLRTI